MIKDCPTCKRTYSDPSITFCLADGSLLSAPFDPEATQHLPVSHNTAPPETEIIHPAPDLEFLPLTQPALKASDMPPTIASSEASDVSDDSLLIDRYNAETSALVGLNGRKGVKLWAGLGILFIMAAVYSGSIIPALPAVVMFVVALFVGLKKSGYERL